MLYDPYPARIRLMSNLPFGRTCIHLDLKEGMPGSLTIETYYPTRYVKEHNLKEGDILRIPLESVMGAMKKAEYSNEEILDLLK